LAGYGSIGDVWVTVDLDAFSLTNTHHIDEVHAARVVDLAIVDVLRSLGATPRRLITATSPHYLHFDFDTPDYIRRVLKTIRKRVERQFGPSAVRTEPQEIKKLERLEKDLGRLYHLVTDRAFHLPEATAADFDPSWWLLTTAPARKMLQTIFQALHKMAPEVFPDRSLTAFHVLQWVQKQAVLVIEKDAKPVVMKWLESHQLDRVYELNEKLRYAYWQHHAALWNPAISLRLWRKPWPYDSKKFRLILSLDGPGSSDLEVSDRDVRSASKSLHRTLAQDGMAILHVGEHPDGRLLSSLKERGLQVMEFAGIWWVTKKPLAEILRRAA